MSEDNTRDKTRFGEEEQKKIFKEFNEKRFGQTHDLWSAQKYRAQLNSKETTALFDQWYGQGGAGPYENDVLGLGYLGPNQTAEHLARYLPAPRDRYQILDIGAGTGLSGSELKKAGFTHVHWLDPSENAMEPAKKTNSYEKFFLEYVSEKPLDIPANTYDAITCVGAFFEGCLPLTAFAEMIRLVKQGGTVIFSISCTSLETCKEYKGRLEPKIYEHVDAKDWELLERIVEPHYLKDVPAVFYIMKVLRS